MRLRAMVTAALGAAGLMLSLPGSALATQGELFYSFDRYGSVQREALIDPVAGSCHRLDLPNSHVSAYRLQNRTDSTAVVFRDVNCASSQYYVLRPGQSAPSDVLARSVLFLR